MVDDHDGWADYESGPFCRHWADPGDCDTSCATCGHPCRLHTEYRGCDGGPADFDCQCDGFRDEDDAA